MISAEVATKVRWECVHFGTLLEGRQEIERCKERGFSAIRVELAGVKDESGLLSKLASDLNFPDYFGMNWNALIDCLRDLSWLNPRGVLVVLENSRDLWREPMLAGTLIEIWLLCAECWAKQDVPFHLGFTWDGC
jgi:RNAse (barnase) inhibitor barstar